MAIAHFAASLLCLQPALVQRSNPKCAKWPAQLGRTTCAPGYYTFDSGTCAIRKTLTVISNTSKTITARWLTFKLKQRPLSMKIQISNEKSQIFPYVTQSCNALGKLEATCKFAASLFCAAQSLFRSILECCGDLGSNSPNDQPAWNLNFKQRLGWLPRQARPSLHGGRRPTRNKCHWTLNFKNQSFSNKTQSWIAVAELVPTYNCPASLFSTAQSRAEILVQPPLL